MKSNLEIDMKNKLYVICTFFENDARNLVPFMDDQYIQSVEPSITSQVMHKIQATFLEKVDEDYSVGFNKNWYVGLEDNFVDEVQSYLENSLKEPFGKHYLYTPLNVFYIDLWRIVAQRLGLEIEFIINWRHLLDPINVKAGAEHLKYVFNAFYSLISSSAYDAYYYFADDLQKETELTEKSFEHFLGSKSIYSDAMPVEIISIMLGASEEYPLNNNLPAEIEAIEKLILGKRFGAQIHVQAAGEELALLDKVVEYKSAIYYWLESLGSGAIEINSFDKNAVTRYQKKIKQLNEKIEVLQSAFRKQFQKMRADNLALKSQNEEFKSIPQSPAKKSIPPARRAQRQVKKQASNNKTDEKDRSQRKKDKFKRDPYAYFNDSKKPLIRPLRFFYRKK
ncbi:MAG: hypothetical protein DIZ78_09840 [endosymbiont of Escarpia spicata]|uniref:Uncharacterized protein n=1 Tax=endosymbiont of Escarpia spicata TaxID=2200908 RepID=A0A370DLS4_9GAMM|nr:MAG: hypothetical protein DIZ78_09840 [endosymbiont of Escarpia spicata]